ncbi:MAG: hypothetical protein ABI670_17485 [Chloroflexota bacterium]
MYQAPAPAASVDPIISRLRPRTVAEILDQAFRLYRRHFLTFIAIIAVVHVPLQLILQLTTAYMLGGLTGFEGELSNGDLSGSSFSSGRMNELFAYLGIVYAVTILVGVLYWLLQSLSQGALTAEVANSHLDKPVSFRDGYRQMLSRLGPLLGIIFLQLGIGIAVFLPIILLLILSFAAGIGSATSGNDGSGAFLGLFCFSCALIIPAFVLFAYIFVRLYIITPIVMVEGLGPVQALRRSWRLVQNYWWRTFAMVVVLIILSYIVQAGPAALVQAIIAIFLPRDLVLQQVISGVVTVFTTLVFIPIQLIAVTLYYFDLRVRKEGYDIEAAMSQRYLPAQPQGAWAGYGQGAAAEPVMPPPALGYGYYGQNYNAGPETPIQQQYSTPGYVAGNPTQSDYTPPPSWRAPTTGPLDSSEVARVEAPAPVEGGEDPGGEVRRGE